MDDQIEKHLGSCLFGPVPIQAWMGSTKTFRSVLCMDEKTSVVWVLLTTWYSMLEDRPSCDCVPVITICCADRFPNHTSRSGRLFYIDHFSA